MSNSVWTWRYWKNLPSLAVIIECKYCPLTLVLARLCQDFLVHVVPDEIGVSQLFEVTEFILKLLFVASGLEAGDFVQNTQVSRTVLYAELLGDFFQKSELVIGEIVRASKLI